ncbi:hypothetical protein MBM_01920 [Drepanopeziza brunnea f. sp. 'multigermtubi' MB_m1]|uniref:Fe2OG dioxygenase domain-containing protein n=1 Tax=Marssonina brunnea f. sp. multigermtubi (strain MB_m1) TaxID=1072389 RepID=K1XGQ1_MARBU|nr:uncharacterized protein MBM_01920 [Drepanopeziza brunnea f. sp. 'multigermtubi' MB_m1]EKD19968.1 hypothetical protein MBM_01920 [Drepanopeziza brunnea f. sp. 'multigermtubi' MB_m1]
MPATQRHPHQIPIIDISASLPQSEVAKQLVDAAATYGFVYVKNEGKDIPVEAIESIFDLSKKFFKSPVAEKEPCKISENNRGWVAMHGETLDPKSQKAGRALSPTLLQILLYMDIATNRIQIGDFKEAMNLGEFVDGRAQQPLPAAFAGHEQELDQFQKYCHCLMSKILVLFGIGLEVLSLMPFVLTSILTPRQIDPSKGGEDWFASRHRGTGPSGCTLRLLHYPPIPPGTDYRPSVDIRAGAHSDYGSITLLFQRPGQPGLEIIPPSSSSESPNWTPVPVFPPTTESDPSPPILVNIGDLLSFWTNNLLKSTVHRVVFPAQERQSEDRYSIAYFGHPIGSTVLEPVPSKMVEAMKDARGGIAGAESMTADEHLMSRLKATYLGMYRDGEVDEAQRAVAAT